MCDFTLGSSWTVTFQLLKHKVNISAHVYHIKPTTTTTLQHCLCSHSTNQLHQFFETIAISLWSIIVLPCITRHWVSLLGIPKFNKQSNIVITLLGHKKRFVSETRAHWYDNKNKNKFYLRFMVFVYWKQSIMFLKNIKKLIANLIAYFLKKKFWQKIAQHIAFLPNVSETNLFLWPYILALAPTSQLTDTLYIFSPKQQVWY